MDELRIHDIVEHMICAERKHHSACDRQLSSLGIHRSQLRMLMCLWRNGEDMTQCELAEKLRISPAVVSVTVQKLESDGYVARKSKAGDKRTVMISLAKRGREIVGQARGFFDEVDAVMFRDFSTEEKIKLVDLCKRMIANLSDIGEEAVK